MMDFIIANQKAWDKQAASQQPWSTPVDSQTIEEAKKGNWEIHLTPTPLNKAWRRKREKNSLFSFCWWATSANIGRCGRYRNSI